uniref:SH3 domain-binding glutamic acid-rich protein n=1 Tax=Riptortus pedestris TaxID=329032 RepID=R4WK27_RIPPE|nr:conserved hypothetical protein [Riptortus pedestris]
MVIKVYTSGISGNKEVKKRQQRIMMILESKNIDYEAIDITEPGKELDKQFMQDNAKAKDSKHPLPPQIFNEDDYCGDYEGFDLANENDELEIFLKLPLPPSPVAPVIPTVEEPEPIIEPPPPVVNGRETDSSINDEEMDEGNEEQNGEENDMGDGDE